MTYMLYLSKKKKTVSEHQFAIHPPFAADEGSHKDVVHSAQLDDLIPPNLFNGLTQFQSMKKENYQGWWGWRESNDHI